MTPEDFVRAIVEGVFTSATADVLAQVESPGGRRPPRASVELAHCYGAPPESDRARLAAVVRRGVHAGMFGMFAVFDGVRRIDQEGGEFELAYVAPDGTRSVLNPPSGAEMLHDLFAGMQILGAVILAGIVRTVVAGSVGAAAATWIALAVLAVVSVVVFRGLGGRP